MTQVTVKELAQTVNTPVERLLQQMREAGLTHSSAEQLVSDAEKQALLKQRIKYVFVLFQENRSFDHYFGSMRGVRGFADPRAVRLPTGKTVWHQPNGATEMLPFRPPVQDLGQAFLPDPPHGWQRPIRRSISAVPRIAPCRSSASSA